ncbi:MAG: putative two-component system response regulator [Oleiphilaceae bacterium]|jgi:putative two-component system response regulator
MDKPSILIVDDEPINIRLLSENLKQDYDLRVSTSGKQAITQLENHHQEIDLILLDVNMPEMSGIEVLDLISKNSDWAEIPVIFVTAMDQECDEAAGLKLGAADYITKPISAPIVNARIKTQLTLRKAKEVLAAQNRILEQEVQKRTEEIRYTQEVIISALTNLALTRDKETGNHIIRTQHYVKVLAQLLRHLPEYIAELDDDVIIDSIFRTAPLHDVGKVGIPDYILLKPGKLTAEEWEIMQTHATLGGDAIKNSCDIAGFKQNKFLIYAQEIAYSHHEKWDGSGYPQALAGNAIPVSARLMAIADVYDALMSRRCYKEAFPHSKVLTIMEEGKGKHFDPNMLQVFLDNEHLFFEIAEKYQ